MKTVLQHLVRYTGLSCALAGLGALPAQAVPTLSLTPTINVTSVGGSVAVDLVVDNLDVNLGFGAWLVEFVYNSGIVSISSNYDSIFGPNTPGGVLFGTHLGSGIDSAQYSLAGGGAVRADETSFLDVDDLKFPGPLVLATFTFTGVSPGTTSLRFDRVELSNAEGVDPLLAKYLYGDPINSTPGFAPQSAFITVLGGSHGVPDSPVALPLVAVVGLLLAFRRHGRRAA